MEDKKITLHELALCRTALQDIRDGDGGVAVGEVGVVAAPGHGDPEPVAGHSAQRHVVQLPRDPLTTLHTKQENMLEGTIILVNFNSRNRAFAVHHKRR